MNLLPDIPLIERSFPNNRKNNKEAAKEYVSTVIKLWDIENDFYHAIFFSDMSYQDAYEKHLKRWNKVEPKYFDTEPRYFLQFYPIEHFGSAQRPQQPSHAHY